MLIEDTYGSENDKIRKPTEPIHFKDCKTDYINYDFDLDESFINKFGYVVLGIVIGVVITTIMFGILYK